MISYSKSKRFYDKEANLISSYDYEKLFKDKEYSLIEEDKVGDCLISTSWVGIDLRKKQGVGRKPIIFETCIYSGIYVGKRWTYCTEEEALAGHEQIYEAISEGDALPKIGEL
jgi:hypothetical protein